MHRHWIVVLIAALAFGAASCGSSNTDAPSCERLVDHFIDVAGAGDRAAFLDECEAMNLDDEQARCAMAAETLVDFDDCNLPVHPRVAGLED